MITLNEQFTIWQNSNQLLVVTLMNNKDGRKDIWGRILSFDISKQTLLLYSDDTKKIYHFSFIEIKDIVPSIVKNK